MRDNSNPSPQYSPPLAPYITSITNDWKAKTMHGLGIGFGLGLIVMGILLFAIGRRKRNGTIASHGSVAIGRDNSGSIFNINQLAPQSGHSGGHAITILAIFVELIGIGVTLWHAYHLAAR